MYFQSRRAKETFVRIHNLTKHAHKFFFLKKLCVCISKETYVYVFQKRPVCMYFKRELFVCIAKETYSMIMKEKNFM